MKLFTTLVKESDYVGYCLMQTTNLEDDIRRNGCIYLKSNSTLYTQDTSSIVFIVFNTKPCLITDGPTWGCWAVL